MTLAYSFTQKNFQLQSMALDIIFNRILRNELDKIIKYIRILLFKFLPSFKLLLIFCTLHVVSYNFIKIIFEVIILWCTISDRLCGLVVRVPGYRFTDLWFDSRRYQIFWEEVSLEWGPLSLVSTIEDLLEKRKYRLWSRKKDYGRKDPLRWPRDTLYPHKVGTKFADNRRTEAKDFFSFSFIPFIPFPIIHYKYICKSVANRI
jgi:hypothetical protein